MREHIRDRIRDHIVDAWLNGDARGFDDASDLQTLGILDSFSTLALASFLDETFHVQLDPSDINTESFRSVNALTGLVTEKLASHGASAELTRN